ncbi:hypothetical protein AAL_05904 [Moelleriella libera RCEF 2490]|uniref:Nephrocystin 3-like N-terminal domain-containing protein n=1 Tax=Moelleriella libera RCEF 2490 TaxID=1081109 RepID=A0A167ZMU0_9HYPO|nr:hypothetical protein AAL_05904 [Moelleriella libera RCEF 2490]
MKPGAEYGSGWLTSRSTKTGKTSLDNLQPSQPQSDRRINVNSEDGDVKPKGSPSKILKNIIVDAVETLVLNATREGKCPPEAGGREHLRRALRVLHNDEAAAPGSYQQRAADERLKAGTSKAATDLSTNQQLWSDSGTFDPRTVWSQVVLARGETLEALYKWVTSRPEHIKFMSGPENSQLPCISGAPGSGKTILMLAIIHRLTRQGLTNQTGGA